MPHFTEYPNTDHAFTMIHVAGGSFTMGETKENHQLADFYIADTPVTQALYEYIMGQNPAYFKGRNRPVEQVSWFDAVIFCNQLSVALGRVPYYYHDADYKEPFIKAEKYNNQPIFFKAAAAGYRLPKEKEWEFAAISGRHSKGYEYAGGNDLDDVGWYNGNSHSETKPVKLKFPNDLNLYDMSGNVWEWCEDWYNKSGSARVLRGGSWFGYPEYCRATFRLSGTPAHRSNNIGFRLACISLQ
jgi:formylglycine-generating enzyme